MHKRKEGILTFSKPGLVLVFVWCISLLIGCSLATRVEEMFPPLFRSIPSAGVSHWSYFFFQMLPFAVTFLVCSFHLQVAIYFLCLFKGIAFSFCCCAVLHVFQSAGLLMNMLLHLSGIVSMFLLLWIWLRYLCRGCQLRERDIYICIALAVFLFMVDVISVFPFCHNLMNLL